MKSIAFVVFCFLCTLTQVAYAEQGGEGEHTQCHGVGNPNSYCDGTEDDFEPPVVCEDDNTPAPKPICVVPTLAVNAFLAQPFVFNADVKACTKQCKALAKTCGGVAKGQGKCYASLIRGSMKHALANCKTVADKLTREQCVWNVRHNSGENLDVFRANTFTARATCKDTVQECVAACQ